MHTEVCPFTDSSVVQLFFLCSLQWEMTVLERKKECTLFFFPCCTHWHPQEHNVWSRAWWKLGPIYKTFPCRQYTTPKDKQNLMYHIRTLTSRHTIFTVKSKHRIHSAWTRTFSEMCLLLLYPSPSRPISVSNIINQAWIPHST